MRRTPFRSFILDETAVSEEFTSLPALSVVMIGFTLFFVLLANVYASYGLRVESLEKYQTADFIATKLTNPDCFFIKEGGLVDLPELRSYGNDDKLNSMRQEYKASNVNFTVRVSWQDGNEIKSEDFPENLPDYIGDRVAVSRDVSVYLNEAQTSPGKLTIILWNIR
jgi:hypothetical protein